jgi:hypothetical protein
MTTTRLGEAIGTPDGIFLRTGMKTDEKSTMAASTVAQVFDLQKLLS